MNMNSLQSIAEGLESASESANPINDGDYQKDGIWYCGKCNTPKQTVVELFGIKKTVHCLCKCKAEEKAQREADEKEERKRAYHQRLIEESMMDERSLNARFETAIINENNSRNMAICKAYAEQFQKMFDMNKGMLFMGEPGTGKTFAAACIANELIDKGRSVIMTSFVKLTNMIQSEQELLEEKMVEADLLIIDDLGAQRNTSYAMEQVYNAINMRYESERPIIVTTNVMKSSEMIGSELGCARVFDRIFQMCVPMQWKGNSWRTQNMRNRMDDFEKELGL